MNKLKDNKELLYKLYIKEKKSLSDIAKDYSVSSMTVRAWLKRVGINTRISTVDIYKELKNTEFSDIQKNMIVGSTLGDGSLVKGKDCVNARFTERHCENQLKYLIWKKNILKPFVKSKVYKSVGKEHIISGIKCKVQNSYIFSTISHSYLTYLHNKFYKDDIKTVPYDLYKMMNGLSFLVWICDDGCFTFNKKNGIYRLDLHTESFDYKDNVFLCREILSKFFNCSFRINSRKYKSGKAYYICLSGKHNLIKLVDKIKPFIPECMEHKFKSYL